MKINQGYRELSLFEELQLLSVDNASLRESLRQSDLRFRNLLDQLPTLAVQGYDADHRVFFWNRASERLYGFKRREAMGRRLEELTLPESERQRTNDAIDAWIRQGEPIPAGEQVLLRKDGGQVHVFSTYVMQHDADDRPELFRFDLDLNSLPSNPMESKWASGRYQLLLEQHKETLMRELHHHIKNQLQGTVGLLKQRSRNNPLLADAINEVVTQLESIAVVYDLQARTRPMAISFKEMMDAIVGSISTLSQCPLQVIQGTEGRGWKLDGEKAITVALVINELVTNATKHLHGQGTQQQVTITCRSNGTGIILSVSNPGQLPATFDLERGHGLGTGLELAVTMLPSEGARLTIDQEGEQVVAELTIQPPLLLPRGGNQKEE